MKRGFGFGTGNRADTVCTIASRRLGGTLGPVRSPAMPGSLSAS
jgi:hypothetical protein